MGIMNISESNNNIIISDAADFDLVKTFECGQCFRWNKIDDTVYTGVAGSHALTISQNGDTICLHDISREDFFGFWYEYFDLERNYSEIISSLSADPVLRAATAYGQGIRILKQDLWETIISFIISASNNIPRIKKIVENLCTCFGTEIIYRGRSYYTFPTPEQLKSVDPDALSYIRAGFRDKYILDASKQVSSGQLNLDELYSLDNENAKKALMSIYGVGNKVADCVMLFGLQRYDAFPVDVWIKRVMEHFYFEGKQQIKDVQGFAHEKFGELCGFAQQYLFYYARENKIE